MSSFRYERGIGLETRRVKYAEFRDCLRIRGISLSFLTKPPVLLLGDFRFVGFADDGIDRERHRDSPADP